MSDRYGVTALAGGRHVRTRSKTPPAKAGTPYLESPDAVIRISFFWFRCGPKRIDWLIRMAARKAQRLGVYAGSFDPLTIGHLWMIEQGVRLFDHLTVAIG